MSDFVSILPPNSTRIERAIEFAMRSDIDLSILSQMMDPNRCPEHLLPWLAWAFSVDFWDDNWPVETRRKVILESIQIHRQKGTVGSIRRALGRHDHRRAGPVAQQSGKQKWPGPR